MMGKPGFEIGDRVRCLITTFDGERRWMLGDNLTVLLPHPVVDALAELVGDADGP